MTKRLEMLAARREQKKNRRLAMGRGLSVSVDNDSRGGVARVSSRSNFYGPTGSIGRSIREALDPSRAPKTLRNEVYQSPQSTHAQMQTPDQPGRWKRKSRPSPPIHQGITSEFVTDDRSKEQKAEEFLRMYLVRRPGMAWRDMLPWSKIVAAGRAEGLSNAVLVRGRTALGAKYDSASQKWSIDLDGR